MIYHRKRLILIDPNLRISSNLIDYEVKLSKFSTIDFSITDLLDKYFKK